MSLQGELTEGKKDHPMNERSADIATTERWFRWLCCVENHSLMWPHESYQGA